MKRWMVILAVLTVASGAWAQSVGSGAGGTGSAGATTAATPAPASGSATAAATTVATAATPVTGTAAANPAAPDQTVLKLAPFWLQLRPALLWPLGASANYFGLGEDGSFVAEYRLPSAPQVITRAELEYEYAPIPARQTVSLASVALGAGYSYNLTPNLGAEAFASAGITYGFFNQTFEGYVNPYAKAGVDLYWVFPPNLKIALGGTFLYQVGLYTGAGAFISASYGFGTPLSVQKFAAPKPAAPGNQPQLLLRPGTGVQFAKVDLNDIYPVFYKYYDDHPIGSAVLHNWEKSPITNVKVSVFVKEYMTDPKIADGPAKLDPGKDANVDLFGLFTKDILANTESTKVSARLSVSGTLNGQLVQYDSVQTLNVLRRNSLTWDDDQKAAAFVSANDPTAVKFAKNLQSMIQPAVNKALDPSLELAIAIHDGLSLFGLTYSNDPVPTLNSDNKTVDYIQFPAQTLDYRGGKCSDFSVLYASMLEAIGVETAFITIPGHIYMAVALQMSPDIARRSFENPDDLIYQNNKVWVPIESTLREGSFLDAWQLAAKEWRENQAKNQARFYPIHDAWKIYQPVGYASSELAIKIPDQSAVVQRFQTEQTAFVSMQIGGQASALLAQAKQPGYASKANNSLAILYARYGQYDKAQTLLEQILAKEQYLPALVNLGNIYFVRGDMEGALKYYNRAFQIAPTNPTVLLCVARANHAEENYATAKKAYAQLQQVAPDLAQQYAYLNLRGEEATRAADASGLRNVSVWQESEN